MAEGKDKFDINNDQKLKQDNLDKSDGPIAKTEIPDGQPEQGILGQANGMTGGDAENYNAGTNWVNTDHATQTKIGDVAGQNYQTKFSQVS